MSGGYEVQIGALGTAAEAARSAAGQLERLHPGPDLQPAATGIPGAVSARVMGQVAAAWGAELTAWEQRARGYAAKLDQAAAAYRSGDDSAAIDFTAADRRMR